MNPVDSNEFLEMLKKRLDDRFGHERDHLWFKVINGRLFVYRESKKYGPLCVGHVIMDDDRVSLSFWSSDWWNECDLRDPKSDPVKFLVMYVKKTRLS